MRSALAADARRGARAPAPSAGVAAGAAAPARWSAIPGWAIVAVGRRARRALVPLLGHQHARLPERRGPVRLPLALAADRLPGLAVELRRLRPRPAAAGGLAAGDPVARCSTRPWSLRRRARCSTRSRSSRPRSRSTCSAAGWGCGRSGRRCPRSLSVVVPWAVVTTAFLTENVAYPACLWAVWAIWRAAAEPSVAARPARARADRRRRRGAQRAAACSRRCCRSSCSPPACAAARAAWSRGCGRLLREHVLLWVVVAVAAAAAAARAARRRRRRLAHAAARRRLPDRSSGFDAGRCWRSSAPTCRAS